VFATHLATCQSPQLAIFVSVTPVQSPVHSMLWSIAQPYSKL